MGFLTSQLHGRVSRTVFLAVIALGVSGATAQNSQGALPLVICRDMAASVTALRGLELAGHALPDFEPSTPTPWLQDCAWVDPCLETFQDGRAAPAAAWILFDGRFLNSTRNPSTAYNAGVEFARVPAGLRVQACEPNFDVLRRTGQHVCNEDTLVTFADGLCPPDNAANHSLLDCVRPLQHAATQIALHWRPEDEKMHFGTLTHAQACSPPPNSLAGTLCDLSDLALIHIPVPVDGTAVRLIRYELLPDFTCAAAPADADPPEYHSRARPPRRLLTCPTDPHGTWTPAADLLSCELTCATGFVPEDNVCVSTCQHLPTSCPRGFHAVSTCTTSAGTHYECEECTPPDGRQTLDWAPATPCTFEACEAGTFRGPTGDAHVCTPCPLNTFSAAAAAVCTHCNTSHTGLYHGAEGGTQCSPCISPARAQGADCPPGRQVVTDWPRVQHLFDLYGKDLDDYYATYCALGYACIPCEPGFYSPAPVSAACTPCAFGAFNPNFGATACAACASGQNTTAIASNTASDCFCDPGFE